MKGMQHCLQINIHFQSAQCYTCNVPSIVGITSIILMIMLLCYVVVGFQSFGSPWVTTEQTALISDFFLHPLYSQHPREEPGNEANGF